jgi:uncharacterized protein (DUF924 family)
VRIDPTITNRMPPLAREILDFWFGPPPTRRERNGFARTPRSMRRSSQRFGEAIEAAIAAPTASGAPTRTARSRASCCSTSSHAMRFAELRARSPAIARRSPTAIDLVDRGLDRTLDRYERSFVYLPFEHSEDRAMQDRSIALFTALARDTGDRATLEWAEKHAAIIRRFGRYPHRNAALGRASTPEEIEFLKEPGSRF